MSLFFGYVIDGIFYLKNSFLLGGAIYLLILTILHFLKIRRQMTWKCIPELLLSIYGIALLKITGIFSLSFSLSGFKNINLIPFIGGSAMMTFLNFLLFLPLGVLLPVVFLSCKKNMKKVVLIGFSLSLGIEFLQMFGGRYAEIDDLIINTAGTLSGYVLYSMIAYWKEDRKKAFKWGAVFCVAVVACFTGIYLLSDNESPVPTGLDAVADDIAEVNVYSAGEKQTIDQSADVYSVLNMQLENCSGIILEPERVSEAEVWNDQDAFIEIVYAGPKTITFENAPNFEMADAGRLLYNATRNILYWGNENYANSIDYTRFDDNLQEHSAQILEQYKELESSIDEYFN